ncbi:hypothetical protein [Streptomyces sp. NRRL WC-3742]|uniref:hypothetical protein n=1 Tax=Streptomyces sp. NRRL WC-3742 TaxID=1463934 RepID=UPI0004C5E678|nr:hypothetical protein [Streptomyces sp. NRRL WC-3742]
MTTAQPVRTLPTPAPAPSHSAIAALLASGRTSGEVRLTGTITLVRRHTTRAGAGWAIVTLADATGAQLDVHVHPRVWAALDQTVVEAGRPVAVTGRINAVACQVEVYCTGLAPDPTAHAVATATVPHEIRYAEGRRIVQAELLKNAPGLYMYELPADVDRGGPCRWRLGHHSGNLLAAFRTPAAAHQAAAAIGTWTDWTLHAGTLRERHLGNNRDQAALDHLHHAITTAGGHLENCAAYGPYGC